MVVFKKKGGQVFLHDHGEIYEVNIDSMGVCICGNEFDLHITIEMEQGYVKVIYSDFHFDEVSVMTLKHYLKDDTWISYGGDLFNEWFFGLFRKAMRRWKENKNKKVETVLTKHLPKVLSVIVLEYV